MLLLSPGRRIVNSIPLRGTNLRLAGWRLPGPQLVGTAASRVGDFLAYGSLADGFMASGDKDCGPQAGASWLGGYQACGYQLCG